MHRLHYLKQVTATIINNPFSCKKIFMFHCISFEVESLSCDILFLQICITVSNENTRNFDKLKFNMGKLILTK